MKKKIEIMEIKSKQNLFLIVSIEISLDYSSYQII